MYHTYIYNIIYIHYIEEFIKYLILYTQFEKNLYT